FRGIAHYGIGDLDLAIADFDKSIALDPKLVICYYFRGKVYAVLGEKDKAISDLEKAIDSNLGPGFEQEAKTLLEELKQ
ncbi:MAG: hypothetical protein MUO76_07020, partial [Anaerolineaceae bacterium]|nr:hypothetical protein [Anaerolineaceae bacterium]